MSNHEITQLLSEAAKGNKESEKELFPLIYKQLHEIARRNRRMWNGNETLNTTALVHEAYLKIVNNSDKNWESRRHFFSVSSKAMRCILVDHAIKHKAQKRGTGLTKKNISDVLLYSDDKADDIIALDEALNRLAIMNDKHSKIVEYRFFCGYSLEETAALMEMSVSTVKRNWNLAKAWLYQDIQRNLSI